MIVLEFETEHYTAWQCVVCHVWRERDYPALVIRTGTHDTVQCREHDEDEEDECECHCHDGTTKISPLPQFNSFADTFVMPLPRKE